MFQYDSKHSKIPCLFEISVESQLCWHLTRITKICGKYAFKISQALWLIIFKFETTYNIEAFLTLETAMELDFQFMMIESFRMYNLTSLITQTRWTLRFARRGHFTRISRRVLRTIFRMYNLTGLIIQTRWTLQFARRGQPGKSACQCFF